MENSGHLPKPEGGVRVDLWCWSVRLHKTRALAAAACKKSQVLVNGQRCRAARPVRVGDEVRVRQGPLERVLLVRGLLRRRVAAKEAASFFDDLTPASEYERVAALERSSRESGPRRDAGAGRPTKRERREIEGFAEVPEQAEAGFEAFVKAFRGRRRAR